MGTCQGAVWNAVALLCVIDQVVGYLVSLTARDNLRLEDTGVLARWDELCVKMTLLMQFQVTISDNGDPEALTSTVTVIVRVEDENDHAPVFPMKIMNFDIPDRPKQKRGRNGRKREKETFLCR